MKHDLFKDCGYITENQRTSLSVTNIELVELLTASVIPSKSRL